MTMARYYIEDDMNTLNLRDGKTGQCLDETSNWLLDGEDGAARDARHLALRQKAEDMNQRQPA